MLLDRAPTPANGHISPDLSCPGHGFALKTQDAEPFRLPEAA
jgi:hypothetical protein